MHNGRVLKILIVIGLLLLTGCVNTITYNEEETDAPELTEEVPETGYPQGEVDRDYIMIDDILYIRVEGRGSHYSVEREGYILNGEIKVNNNRQKPKNNYEGCHVEEGSKIYINSEQKEIIYVEDKEYDCLFKFEAVDLERAVFDEFINPNLLEPYPYPDDEIWWSYVMINDILYLKDIEEAIGDLSAIPDGFAYSGNIRQNNIRRLLTSNLEGSHVEEGAEIYANPEQKDIIYIYAESLGGVNRFCTSEWIENRYYDK